MGGDYLSIQTILGKNCSSVQYNVGNMLNFCTEYEYGKDKDNHFSLPILETNIKDIKKKRKYKILMRV